MQLLARNNNLVVELIEEKQETASGILLPEDYKTEESPFKVVKLINANSSNESSADIGCNMVVMSHLIQQFTVCGKTYTIVPSSAVIGVFKEGQ